MLIFYWLDFQIKFSVLEKLSEFVIIINASDISTNPSVQTPDYIANLTIGSLDANSSVQTTDYIANLTIGSLDTLPSIRPVHYIAKLTASDLESISSVNPADFFDSLKIDDLNVSSSLQPINYIANLTIEELSVLSGLPLSTFADKRQLKKIVELLASKTFVEIDNSKFTVSIDGPGPLNVKIHNPENMAEIEDSRLFIEV